MASSTGRISRSTFGLSPAHTPSGVPMITHARMQNSINATVSIPSLWRPENSTNSNPLATTAAVTHLPERRMTTNTSNGSQNQGRSSSRSRIDS
ncbi:unannotated protein [freshwater metagenome]|uniref:Unannotated protein n=1 Tax=freshwater metagenome TaxID=449393 RepID=A0A6J7C9B8_9ZZZZ